MKFRYCCTPHNFCVVPFSPLLRFINRSIQNGSLVLYLGIKNRLSSWMCIKSLCLERLKLNFQFRNDSSRRCDEMSKFNYMNWPTLVASRLWRKPNWILKLPSYLSLSPSTGSLLSFVDRRRTQRIAAFLTAKKTRRTGSWRSQTTSCQSAVWRRK